MSRDLDTENIREGNGSHNDSESAFDTYQLARVPDVKYPEERMRPFLVYYALPVKCCVTKAAWLAARMFFGFA